MTVEGNPFQDVRDRLYRARASLIAAELEHRMNRPWQGAVKCAEEQLQAALEEVAGLRAGAHQSTKR